MAKKQKRQVLVEMDIKEKKVEGRNCPTFRVSYPHVFEPTDFDGNGEEKYRLVMLFSKKADLEALETAVENATIETYGKDKKKWPSLISPFRNGNEVADQPEYKNMIVVSASSRNKPQVVDRNKEVLTTEDEFYAGCYAKASLIAFTYDVGKNKGVSFALQNLQKVKDGERLSGKPSADDEFDNVEEDDDFADQNGPDSDDPEGEEDYGGF